MNQGLNRLSAVAAAVVFAATGIAAVPPASIEISIEGFPSTLGSDKDAVWALHVDDIRLTQSRDPNTPDGLTLLGPQSNDGDFEAESAWSAISPASASVAKGSVLWSAGSGEKYLVMAADAAPESQVPRIVKTLAAPDLEQGRYFVLTAKLRTRDGKGIAAARLTVAFKGAEGNATFVQHQTGRTVVSPYEWTELKLAFDYDKGIPPPRIDGRMPMDELTDLIKARRAKYPPYETTPRPDDGRNLALSVAKLEGRAGIPGKPFLIWAVGASWTAGLGNDGRQLEYAIRQRFSFAPPIHYKMHAGSQTQWNHVRGWVSQFVIPDQPDLIITYTNGDPALLEAMIQDIRARTTADIIVPTLHLMVHEDSMREDFVEGGGSSYGVPLSAIREVCRRHGVEFVENRRELAQYLRRIGQKPSILRTDGFHQNEHGVVRTWDNISRHFAWTRMPAYKPESRERRVAVSPAAKTSTESVELSPGWVANGPVVRTTRKGERIKVRFTGNRIDLIGRYVNGGGSVKVFIDNQPAGEAPVFFTTRIKVQPIARPWKLPQAGQDDVGPHGVELGANLVPQTWTITVTSETGDYRLVGSVTGPDGEGKSPQDFTSRSGQIRIDPKLWRYNAVGTTFGNRPGDKYAFEVYRAAVGSIRFSPAKDEPLHRPLVQNLEPGVHTLEIVTEGDGEVVIDSFYVFQPPGKKP